MVPPASELLEDKIHEGWASVPPNFPEPGDPTFEVSLGSTIPHALWVKIGLGPP